MMKPGTPLVLLGDGPQTVDLLGYQPYVDAMAGVLAGEQLETPFCIGIFGQWGTGKSTFMALLNQQLDKSANGNFNTLFFQPWQFEEKEEVWKALLLSTLRYLEVELERGKSQIEQEYTRVKQTLTDLIVGVGKLAIDKAVKTVTSDLVSSDDIFEAYAKTSRDNSKFINTFREEFKNIKDEILNAQGNSQGRLFIFVDDLDRCTPENCMMVLESIKLFFDLEECVFILGIDREVVQKGIEHKYKQSINIKGQDYLDKMIQLPFSLPPVSEETFEKFIRHTTERLEFNESINQLIQIASESNPRRVKRISNCLQLVRNVAVELLRTNTNSVISGDPDEAKLALLLTLQVRYPIAYAWLVENPIPLNELISDGINQQYQGNIEEQKPEVLNRSTNADASPKERLMNFLVISYGKENGELVLNEFLQLWQFAHQKAQVPEFSSQEEMRVYIGITGVVEEDRKKSVREEVDSFNARKSVDQKYYASDLDNGIPDEQQTADTPPPQTSKPQDLSTIKDRAQLTVSKWNHFRNKGTFVSLFSLLGLTKIGERIVDEANVVRDFVKSLNDPLLQSEIEAIQLKSVCQQVLATSKLFILIVPVILFACWNIIIKLYQTNIDGYKELSYLEWMTNSLFGIKAIGASLVFWSMIFSVIVGLFSYLSAVRKKMQMEKVNNLSSVKQASNASES